LCGEKEVIEERVNSIWKDDLYGLSVKMKVSEIFGKPRFLWKFVGKM